jgi:hypothetical protein
MGKVMYDGGRADKNLALIVRIGIGAIMLITFLLMFVINPHSTGSAVDTKNLWEAVHPYHLLFDTVALAGLVFFALFISGLAGKVVYAFVQPPANSTGLIKVIAGISALATLLFFV